MKASHYPMKPQRPKVEPIRNPTLFEMEKLEKAPELAGELKIERPYSLPGILLGTSAFTANGWQCSFYPAGMKRDSKRLKWIARFMAHLLPRRLRSGTRRRRILSSPRRSRES